MSGFFPIIDPFCDHQNYLWSSFAYKMPICNGSQRKRRAARFVNSSFNLLDLFGLLGGYMYHSHRCCQLHLSLSL
ncbi:hypothetical protein IGI04_002959 [Brassica rapa subsp. trilocularis]|uniref:Uncharacterized protein n=1 Tax=Brassica rapa subsp. trilocularis TaxID=1813537 RepID=A0ABQ7NX06_BRACM|nr:hypothetical protein IGI04_002959 [Brassica rapa subsp. trilocularis]